MEQMTDSDAAMVANENFENILRLIGNSCLNYRMEVSPFSAVISLRKTIIKDKTGLYITPQFCKDEKSDLRCEIRTLEKKLNRLQHMINDRDDTIQKLNTVNMVSGTLHFKLNKKFKQPFTFNQNYSEMTTGIQDLGNDIRRYRDFEESFVISSYKEESTCMSLPPSELLLLTLSIKNEFSAGETASVGSDLCCAEYKTLGEASNNDASSCMTHISELTEGEPTCSLFTNRVSLMAHLVSKESLGSTVSTYPL